MSRCAKPLSGSLDSDYRLWIWKFGLLKERIGKGRYWECYRKYLIVFRNSG